MATVFPALVKAKKSAWISLFLILVNTLYAIIYQSSTVGFITIFYFLLFSSPGYKFFKQIAIAALICFVIGLIYLHPYLSVMYTFKPHSDVIRPVMKAHTFLALDPNNTWRLILWDQLLFARFPENLFGIGFGTPAFQYFPVEDYAKMSILPYVVGAHNSFIYLFGRLGIVFIILIALIYRVVFREYFYFKNYYYTSKTIAVFWSFFAITIIALFNPALETPIFAGAYWFILGLVAKVIQERKHSMSLNLQPV